MKALAVCLLFLTLIFTAHPFISIGTANAQTNYTYSFSGPFYDDGEIANAAVSFAMLFVNQTIYRFDLVGTGVAYDNITIVSEEPAQQLLWNASSALNFTRVIDFMNAGGVGETHNIYIPSPETPAYYYQFIVSDVGANMVNPFLEISISDDGETQHVVERRSLSNANNPTFVMAQYGTYTLNVICNQGTYTQSFTAENSFSVEIPILAGVFPIVTGDLPKLSAYRYNETIIIISYSDPTANTAWLYVNITHRSIQTWINDYVTNNTANSQTIVFGGCDEDKTYVVYGVASVNSTLYTWRISVSNMPSDNVWLGTFDFLGVDVSTLPHVYTGWNGLTSAQIAQLVAAGLMLLFLGIGSFRSAGASMFMAWCFGGVMLAVGWYNGGAVIAGASSLPLFGFAGFLTVLIHFGERKQT